MRKCCLTLVLSLLLFCSMNALAQKKPSPWSFRLGPAVSFGLSNMNANNVGFSGIAGAEKKFHPHFAAETELSYHYFTGDKVNYVDGRNKAWAIPLLAGIKAFMHPQVYASLRTGPAVFLLNDMPDAALRLAYGAALGFNLPHKINRINTQLQYTSFRYNQVQRGYATLAVAIIIN